MATTFTQTKESKPINLTDNTNPLHQFRSYSYQFVIVAAASTNVIAYLSSPAATNAFERSQFNLTAPRDIITCPAGDYVILIDTRSDADICVDEVHWGTTFIGDLNSSGSATALNTVMTDGTITFLEPRGVNFLNLLANLGDQLDVDMVCMPFVLKTMFFGHTDSGDTIYLNETVNIQPFGFIPVDITAQVDERGTVYKMDICSTLNGITFNPIYSAIVDNLSFPVINGLNLTDHLALYSKVVQTEYNRQREQVIRLYGKQIDFSNAAQIKYDFSLEPGSQELQYITDFGANQPGQLIIEDGKHLIKGTKEGGMVEVINKLLTSSKQWVKICAQGAPPDSVSGIDESGTRYSFRITQEFLNSSPGKQNQVNVNIIVSEYRYDTVEVVSNTANHKTQELFPKIDPSQVVTYDYIFTGQNMDVLSMNINLSMGLALLQTLATAKALSTQGVDCVGGQLTTPSIVANAAPNAGGCNISGKIRRGTPIFAPLQWVDNYLKEMNDVQNTATAEAIWKTFASYQSVNTKAEVAGNPLLLAKLINPNRSVPNYVKINVKMPTSPDDVWEYQTAYGQTSLPKYYQDFWYTGYYVLVSAKNKFSGGLFTQELDLVSLPQTSSIQGAASADESVSDTPPDVRARVRGKVAATTAAPSTTSQTPSAPVSPKSNTANAGSLSSTKQKNPASTTHQEFVANYWNYAVIASQTSGLDPSFTLAQAAVETGWGTNSFCQDYSAFFNARSYGATNAYWTGAVIPNTDYEAGNPVPPFRAYINPSNSFLDQYGILTRMYPKAAAAPPGASGINIYANGLINGKGGVSWDATNPPQYASNIISAYNEIQTYKSNLNIQDKQLYAGSPTPTLGTVSTPTNYLPVITPAAVRALEQQSSAGVIGASQYLYATQRTIAQAAIAQKTPVQFGA